MKKYKKPVKVKGWDFSQIKVIEEGPNIEYAKIVESRLEKNKTLLDIGTGGAERLLGFALKVDEAIAIDVDRKMIETAAENLSKCGLQNVALILCDSEKLPIMAANIDVVICRQAPFNAREVARVLKQRGIFVTQQVSEGDKRNFKTVFRRGQDYGRRSGTKKRRYLRMLRESGMQVIEERTINTIEYYQSMDDVIFLIANTPMILDFDFGKEQDKLKEIEEKFRTTQGIKTNSERFLIVGKKTADISMTSTNTNKLMHVL